MNRNEIFYDPAAIRETTVNIEQIVEKFNELAGQTKMLPFGENAPHQSSGHCADALDIVAIHFHDTLLQMAGTITALVEYIKAGSENMEETDKYLASLLGTVSISESTGGTGNADGDKDSASGGGGGGGR